MSDQEQQERQPLLNSENRQNGNNNSQSIVDFQEQDSENPRNWSKRRRWFFVALLCLFAAVVTYTCIGIVPVAGDMVKELEGEEDDEATVLFVTIWELGEAMGPLFIAPLSELYGRFRVYNIANVCFICGIVVTALSQNVPVLVFSRFLTGCAVATNVLNPAIIGDIFPSETRGAAMSAVMLAPLIGGAIGPTVSGALAEATGWREILWLCVAVAGVIEILFLTTFKETYHPTILKRRAAKKRQETGDDSYCTNYDDEGKSNIQTLKSSMARPPRIIWSSSLLQALSIWGGVMFAFFYVNSTILPMILEKVYGFGPSKRGLSYLAWTLGSVVGITVCNRGMDKIYNRLTKKHGGHYPEGRLPIVIVGAFLLPLGVLLYGWTASLHTSVWAYLSTVTLLCISVVFSIVPMMTYITDAFGEYSASAMTAVLVTRCLLGAFLPLAVPPMQKVMGYGWAFTILAAIAIVLSPIPCLVMRYGPTWRQRSSFTKDK